MNRKLLAAGIATGAALVVGGLLTSGSVLSAVGLPDLCLARAGQTVEVSTGNELRGLMACRPSNITIALAPGQYGRVTMNGLTNVTLRSQNAARPATFEQLAVTGSQRIAISQLRFAGNGAGLQFRLQIGGSRDVTASDLNFPGQAGRFDDVTIGHVSVRASERVELARLKMSWVMFGISYLDVDGLTIRDSAITNVRSDAMRGGGVSNLLITGNRLTGFFPVGQDHPDGVQIWTTNQKTPSRNIRIIDNLIQRGQGRPAQGIFIRDETRTLPHENVEIADNVIIGALWNGIALSDARGVNVHGNTVLGLPDQVSWLLVRGVADATVSDNRAAVFQLGREVRNTRNRAGRVTTAEIDAVVRRWDAAHPKVPRD